MTETWPPPTRPTDSSLGVPGCTLTCRSTSSRRESPMTLQDHVDAIASRQPGRSEATLQADIRQLLLTAPIGLEESDLHAVALESPVGDGRRIDIELGSCVVEVKKDLSNAKVAADAIGQFGRVPGDSGRSDRLEVRWGPDGRHALELLRNLRSDSESAIRHAIARSPSSPSKYPTSSARNYTPGGMLGRPRGPL